MSTNSGLLLVVCFLGGVLKGAIERGGRGGRAHLHRAFSSKYLDGLGMKCDDVSDKSTKYQVWNGVPVEENHGSDLWLFSPQ